MATPVGPAERDPNDPDLWDWGDDDEEEPTVRTHPARAILTAALVLVLVVAIAASLV